ncbi:DUF763 domain-containing protein [Treponema sp.]|uniref:DUF763 domain-containing protein n=1 Tax=Treponema sp. TaxID=166 RepID=UPI003F0E5034
MPSRTGHADLPLHTGTVPMWLADRMKELGTLIVESLLIQQGKKEVLRRLSDPLWFQSFGAVLGMDWHSSGITTSVMYALKRGINPRAREFGLCICGGRGKYSRKTPEELMYLSDATGLDGNMLVNASRLTAKVDGAAVQDGFQLYQHNFILSDQGDWAVVQQGMNTQTKTARRYHWCSQNLTSFVQEPHSGVTGENKGEILNLTDSKADGARNSILSISREHPDRIIKEIKSVLAQDERSISLPFHHNVTEKDVDLKRLGAVLATAYEAPPENFESLLLTPGLGPRTLQSLTLISEVINGTPSRFKDPARFSFAHGGKDGHPFPVPLKIYDESIRILGDAIEKSKLGYSDKSKCINRLHATALQIEKNCEPEADFEKTIRRERENSAFWGGKTV